MKAESRVGSGGIRRGLGAAAAATLAVHAGAQPAIRPVGPPMQDPSSFRRVDPMVGDTDPLRMSLRELSVDLRLSDDFSNVYQLPGGQFARRSGGITAVFPRSSYAPMNGGAVAEIPAGTVFYLDGVPAPQPWELIGQGMGTTGVRTTTGIGATRRMETGMNTSVRWAELAAAATEAEAEAGSARSAGTETTTDEGLFVGVRSLLRRAAGEG